MNKTTPFDTNFTISSPNSLIPRPIVVSSNKKKEKQADGSESINSTGTLDDSAYLDEVIASACHNESGSHNFSDGYIDEVIGREVTRSNSKEKVNKNGTSSGGSGRNCISEEKRQQICDSIVQRYLRATGSDVQSAPAKSSKVSPPTKPVKRLSTFTGFVPKCSAARKPSLSVNTGVTAIPVRKHNVVTALMEQQTMDCRGDTGESATVSKESWSNFREDTKGALEQQLRNVTNKLAVSERETENLERKLKATQAANEALESKVAELTISQDAIKEDILARNEEVRQRNSNVMRLDCELSEKEKRLEHAVNATIEAEKKIFDLEINVKSLNGKLSLMEEENSTLREESSFRTSALQTKSLEMEEASRKIVILEQKCEKLEEDFGVLTGKLEDRQRLLEDYKEETRVLRMEVKSLEKEARDDSKEVEISSEQKSKEDFAALRSKFGLCPRKFSKCDIGNQQEKVKLDPVCGQCADHVTKIEQLEEVLRKSRAELEVKLEDVRRMEHKEGIRLEKVEALTEEKLSLQKQLKKMETALTSHEVEVGRMKSKVSILEENVLNLDIQVKEHKEQGQNMTLVLEEMGRERKSLEMKLCTSEDEQDKLREEAKKLRADVGVKEDELMLYETKLNKSVEDLDGCYNRLLEAKKEHNDTLMKLEAAEESIKTMNYQNIEVNEKCMKLSEENTKVIKEKEEAVENLEELERNVCVIQHTVDKLSEEAEKYKRDLVQYQQEMERHLTHIVEM